MSILERLKAADLVQAATDPKKKQKKKFPILLYVFLPTQDDIVCKSLKI